MMMVWLHTSTDQSEHGNIYNVQTQTIFHHDAVMGFPDAAMIPPVHGRGVPAWSTAWRGSSEEQAGQRGGQDVVERTRPVRRGPNWERRGGGQAGAEATKLGAAATKLGEDEHLDSGEEPGGGA
nr:uncharacterized protein LOC109776560 [Aegilops tauschii subsp. strangulata]